MPGERINHRKHWPFITYTAFQDDVVKEIWEAIEYGHDILVEKSRDMGATWMILAVFMWFCQFQQYVDFGVSSWKEIFVYQTGNPDTLFWKMEYLLKKQPPWMRPAYTMNKLILRLTNTRSTVTGETANENMFVSGRKKALFPDEFAKMDYQESFEGQTGDVAPCRIFNSTPQGRGNTYANLRFGGHIKVLTLHWRKHPEKSKGMYTTYPGGGLKLLDPDHIYPNDGCWIGEDGKHHDFTLDGKIRSPWYDFECWRRASKKLIAQELDIDYLASGEAFFDLDVLQDIRNSGTLRPPDLRGDMHFEVQTLRAGHSYRVGPATFVEGSRGALSLWTRLEGGRPPQDDHYVGFCDISLGQGASNSICRMASVTKREIVATWASPDYSPSDFARVCVALWRWFGGDTHEPYVGWEANGSGGTFGIQVFRLGYWSVLGNPDLKKFTEEERERNKLGGWWSTGGPNGTKIQLLGNLRGMLARGEIIDHDERFVTEAEKYILFSNGTPGPSEMIDEPEGGRAQHGDFVIGSAGLPLCLAEQPKIKPRKMPIPWGSAAYYEAEQGMDKPSSGIYS